MDADWGSSSDEEDVAARAARDAAKLQETMALLQEFEQTREPVKKDYGAMDAGSKFRQERSQAAGRAIWEVRCRLPASLLFFLHFASIRLSPAPALLPPTSDAHENGLHPSPWVWSAKIAHQTGKSG